MDRYLEFVLNHYILSLSFAVVSYLLIQEFFDTAFKQFKPLSPLAAVSKMNSDEVMIVDVRDPIEFTSKHLEDATNIPLDKLSDQLVKLGDYKEKPILIICQDGIRSASAAKTLAKAGFQQIFVITGGITAWEEEYKLPVRLGKNKKTN